MWPNEITGAKAGGPRQLRMRPGRMPPRQPGSRPPPATTNVSASRSSGRSVSRWGHRVGDWFAFEPVGRRDLVGPANLPVILPVTRHPTQSALDARVFHPECEAKLPAG